MSKKSVFKFTINDSSRVGEIENIIKQYLSTNNFEYNEQKNCYKSISRGQTGVPGYGMVVDYTSTWGFEYKIENNLLIIKSFVDMFNPKLNFLHIEGTNFIHSKINPSPAGMAYYDNIQNELFVNLEKMNLELTSKEIERVYDGSTIKLILVFIGIWILSFVLLAIFIFLMTRLG